MAGPTSPKDEAKFKEAFKIYEHGMTYEIIAARLGIESEKIPDFLAYARKRSREKLKLETVAWREMDNSTREAINLTPEKGTPLSPTAMFDQKHFDVEFNDEQELARLETMYVNIRLNGHALDALFESKDPEHLEFVERYNQYADFRDGGIPTPLTPSRMETILAVVAAAKSNASMSPKPTAATPPKTSKPVRSRAFQFFHDKPISDDWTSEEEHICGCLG